MEISGPRVYRTAILYLAFPTFFEWISQNGYLHKCKSLLKKLTLWTQEEKLLKGSLVRKSLCIMIRGKFRNDQTSVMELLCGNSWQLKAVTHFCKKLHRRCLAGFWTCLWWWLLLNTEKAFPMKQKFCLVWSLKRHSQHLFLTIWQYLSNERWPEWIRNFFMLEKSNRENWMKWRHKCNTSMYTLDFWNKIFKYQCQIPIQHLQIY